MSSALKELGFRDPVDIWEPWCIAMVDGKIGFIAETVRIGEAGVEVGVDTVPELHGRGYGAATRLDGRYIWRFEIVCASTAMQSRMTRPRVSQNSWACVTSARICGSRKYGPRLERSPTKEAT